MQKLPTAASTALSPDFSVKTVVFHRIHRPYDDDELQEILVIR